MLSSDYQKLKFIRQVLIGCFVLLLLALIASVLSSVMHYLILVIGAVAVMAFHWLTRNNKKVAKWRKWLAMIMPVLTILAPFVYLFFLVMGSSKKWLLLMQLCSVLLPLLLLAFAIYSLGKIIDQL